MCWWSLCVWCSLTWQVNSPTTAPFGKAIYITESIFHFLGNIDFRYCPSKRFATISVPRCLERCLPTPKTIRWIFPGWQGRRGGITSSRSASVYVCVQHQLLILHACRNVTNMGVYPIILALKNSLLGAVFILFNRKSHLPLLSRSHIVSSPLFLPSLYSLLVIATFTSTVWNNWPKRSFLTSLWLKYVSLLLNLLRMKLVFETYSMYSGTFSPHRLYLSDVLLCTRSCSKHLKQIANGLLVLTNGKVATLSSGIGNCPTHCLYVSSFFVISVLSRWLQSSRGSVVLP